MATTGYSSSNYHSVADHADLTHPNTDWSEILVLKTGNITTTQVIISNGASYGANTRQLFQFDDSLELVVNGDDGTLISGLAADTWYLVVLHRSSSQMQVKLVKMGLTSVSTGGLVSLSATSNSTGATYLGRNNDGAASPFSGTISDWLFVPGVSISNADMQAIATGAAIDSFGWYSSANFWGILEDSTNTDYIGSKTITEVGTVTSAADSVDLVRFGPTGETINGVIAPIAVDGVAGSLVVGRTIDGSIATNNLVGLQGSLVVGRTINGNIGLFSAVGVQGLVIDPDSAMHGMIATINIVGLSGSVHLSQTINGSVSALALSGVSGQSILSYIIDGTPGGASVSGLPGSILLDMILDGSISTIQLNGVSGSAIQTFPPPVPTTLAGSNIFFIGKNAIDTASLTASTTASGFDVDNLKINRKSKIHRSTGTSLTLTGTWSTAQTMSGLGLAFTNLDGGSTVQIEVYAETADPSPIYDSGAVSVDFSYDAPEGFSTIGLTSFSFGGGTYFAHLFDDEYSGKKLVLTISSSTNPDGYIEISRVICGFAFTPTVGASYGAQVGHDDQSTMSLTDSGDVITNRGTIAKSLSLTLSVLEPVDRQALVNMIRTRGLTNPIFASIYNNSTNFEERQGHMIYGMFNGLPTTSMYNLDLHNSSITINEI